MQETRNSIWLGAGPSVLKSHIIKKSLARCHVNINFYETCLEFRKHFKAHQRM